MSAARLAVVVAYLNEAEYLPTLLGSIAAQTRLPDELILVDDGSSDASPQIAEAFAAEHPYARALRRPPRPPERDRLATAAELLAFQWGVEQLSRQPDVVTKLDADLRLSSTLFETAERTLICHPGLGITGSYLAVQLPGGKLQREFNPADTVRGPNKFYRWACYQDIQPLAAHLGWDTVDEMKAKLAGWDARSFALSEGDPLHLRPTGLHDGRLRAFRRWGLCAWGYGAHPLVVLGGAVMRFFSKPYVFGGLSYGLGWALAGVRRAPRAEPAVRAFARREKLRYVAHNLRHPSRALFLRP